MIDCFINNVLFESNILTFLITLIAGIFGFIIATIPLTIQLLEIKDNKFIKIINEPENINIKNSIFNCYIDMLKFSFYFIIIILSIELFKFILRDYSILKYIFFIIFIIIGYKFLKKIYLLIWTLKELIDIYLGKKN
ncbi:hypothetical protein N5912_05830 [Arcobacter lacus]|uniref:hypothetical protein n=1 Tax=Arcobacter lacus TaxID=1912876 RepID=UPI0021BA82F3|nr:hypothetical protein [Arcobacter lacus]MCT7911338.1 hypothetical protein [Arcobacter lacus]